MAKISRSILSSLGPYAVDEGSSLYDPKLEEEVAFDQRIDRAIAKRDALRAQALARFKALRKGYRRKAYLKSKGEAADS